MPQQKFIVHIRDIYAIGLADFIWKKYKQGRDEVYHSRNK